MYGPSRINLKVDDPGYPAHGASWAAGAPFAMEARSTLRLDLAVTQAGGTLPTLDVTVEHGPTEAGPWSTLGSFAQATGVGTQHKVFGPCDAFVRCGAALVGGTLPAIRFTVGGHAL